MRLGLILSNGNIFIDHQNRSWLLAGNDLVRRYYTDRIPLGIDLPSYAVAVICVEDGRAAAVGVFRRGGRITHKDRRYEVSDIALLDDWLPLAEVLNRVSPNVRNYLSSAIQNKTSLPDATSRELIRVLSSHSSNAAELVERSSGSPQTLARATEGRRILLAQEKDSLGLIADLSGLGRSANSRGRGLVRAGGEVDPSRTYLESVRLNFEGGETDKYTPDFSGEDDPSAENDEDSLIPADMERFDGIIGQRARRYARGMVIHHPQGPITVLNANKKNNLEGIYGCDLIYYHAVRHSAVMVQYKNMREDGGRWVYRGDAQLTKELERMREMNPSTYPVNVAQYRLNPGLHFLKVVRPVDYDGQSTELMEGMYIPLELVDLMLDSEDDTTRGGSNLLVVRDNDRYLTQRHINNTTFTNLFRDGWIGSCGTTSDQIRELVDRYFDAGDLVTIAIDERVKART